MLAAAARLEERQSVARRVRLGTYRALHACMPLSLMHACHWHCLTLPAHCWANLLGLTCWGRGEQCALRIGPNERRSWSGGETMWTVHINTTRTILPSFCLGLNINWLIVLMDPVKTKEYKAAYYQRNKHKFREWANARYHRTNPKSREEILDAIVALQKRLQALPITATHIDRTKN